MWIAITVVGVVALVVLTGIRLASKPAEEVDSDPHDQPATIDSTPDLPQPGSHVSPHRADGSPVPGSEEDRNDHGRA